MNETSETSRDIVVNSLESVKNISPHVPKHFKPLNDEQFGHYLAGLIDGDGHFSKIGQLVIVFSHPDAFLAYYIKEKLGYGNVRKVKNKNAYLFVVSNKDGIFRVLNLINGKLRTENKLNQVIRMLQTKYSELEEFKKAFFSMDNCSWIFSINNSLCFHNRWLAGFSDADSSFQIKIINRSLKRTEVRLNFQIDQKKVELLIKIKSFLGGNISYRKDTDNYYYGSTSFGSARKIINYFDHFHLQSRKHISYLRWRKAYIIIQKKEHLTKEGLMKITRIKEILNKH